MVPGTALYLSGDTLLQLATFLHGLINVEHQAARVKVAPEGFNLDFDDYPGFHARFARFGDAWHVYLWEETPESELN